MQLDLSRYRISLVICPVDMRCGYRSLSAIAEACLGIRVDGGKDCVIFASGHRSVCKVIWSDEKGCNTLVRKLRQGRFQQLVVRAEQGDTVEISAAELMQYLDGEKLQSARAGFLCGF